MPSGDSVFFWQHTGFHCYDPDRYTALRSGNPTSFSKMEMKLLFVLFSVFQLSLGLALETVRKTASVKIRNNSQKPIEGVSVVHKYSSVYVDEHTFKAIQPGATSNEELTVEYNIGLLTTGRDWWKVSWVSDNTTVLTYTNPNNFRSSIDWFERTTSEILPFTGWILGGTVGGKHKGKGKATGAATAKAGSKTAASPSAKGAFVGGIGGFLVGKSITNAVANQESTEGFKQHTLRESDSDTVTTIIIENNGTVTFESISGTSTTVTSSRRLIRKDLVEFQKGKADENKVPKPLVV